MLSSLIKKDKRAILKITSWTNAKNLWQRRASLVVLRPIVKEKKYLPIIKKQFLKSFLAMKGLFKQELAGY